MLERSMATEHVRDPQAGRAPVMDALFSRDAVRPARNLLFARVNQHWAKFIRNVPHYVMVQRAIDVGGSASDAPQEDADVATREAFFATVGVDLGRARAAYDSLGGKTGTDAMNDVATNFTALPERILDQLADHAAWQIYAGAVIYDF
jgi:hypothetical protein